jgi:hypothetical protein
MSKVDAWTYNLVTLNPLAVEFTFEVIEVMLATVALPDARGSVRGAT